MYETSCDEPPNVQHAVVLQKYQDIFAADSEVRYECEHGYSLEGTNARKSVFCVAGSWTVAPSCKISKPGAGDDVDTSGGIKKPVDGSRGRGRGTASAAAGAAAARAAAGVAAGGSTASETGSGTTSDRTESTSSPMTVAVVNCGSYPKVKNGDVVRRTEMFLKYACNGFYKRVGPEKVMCYNNNTWSTLPTCKEAFCQLDLDEYTNYKFQESGTIILKERETKSVACIWENFSSRITCAQGKVRLTQCCHYMDHYYQRCN
ncbi:complement receptor type 2-like [Phycodurus eques]|uniref:complement receptor type 2-like n=1 Tax=Phycodurus eques TaxID=693459 RepID=UPI002ACE330A|nr:complement receptor type 2-like [Phycodurus eques]